MWLTKVVDHADRRVVSDLFIPLTDGVLAGTASDCMVQTAAAIALAAQGLPPFLPCFPVAGTSSANIYGIRVSE